MEDLDTHRENETAQIKEIAVSAFPDIDVDGPLLGGHDEVIAADTFEQACPNP